MASLGVFDKGGRWFRGHVQHEGAHFLFYTVGTAARTAHDYNNYFDGPTLVAEGATGSHADQPSVRALTSADSEVHVFWRSDGRNPFTYAGLGVATTVSQRKPVQIRWHIALPEFRDPESQSGDAAFREGAKKSVTVNARERNPEARKACIRRHGLRCSVCSLDFEERFGDLGKGFIHVHHLNLLSRQPDEHVVNAFDDLVPVCPNCHAMLHRTDPPMLPGDLRKILQSRRMI
jgi:5-methylcytosine-specific restriction protein A